jgi:periplasmic divalent cation tolerance protein
MKNIFVYITNPTKKEAEKIARHLLGKRLIACANIFPVESFYWWKGKIENAKEFVLIGKTKEKNYERIIKEIEGIHSYSIPCVAKLPASFNGKYEKWLTDEIEK